MTQTNQDSNWRAACKICKEMTTHFFNIAFDAVPICQSCSLAITKQEVSSWDCPTETVESK